MVILGVILIVIAVILLLIRRSRQGKLRQIAGGEAATAKELTELAQYVSLEIGGKSAFSRVVEVEGIVKCDNPLISEVAKQPCVYYHTNVSREYEETYYETEARTNRQVQRTRRSSQIVASNSQRVGFWVEDATGRVKVNPSSAEIDSVKVVDKFEPGDQGSWLSLGRDGISLGVGDTLAGGRVGSRTIGYRFSESTLPLDRQVYVLGEANDSSGALVIQAPGQKGRKFIISLKLKAELIRSTTNTIQWLFYGAIICGVAGAAAIVAGVLG